MKIETSLSAGYQRDTWTVRDALRELISNALDGESRLKPLGLGKASLKYDAGSRTVVVSNVGATVPTKALLMGTSESRDVDEAIGQFGEGLPMALLVLAREGRQVTIYNGEEKWTPVIERSSKFSGEHVLVVNTRKVTDRGRFEVHVSPIEPDQWNEAQRLFLTFDPNFDPRAVVEAGRQERILLQPVMKGRIYCKGVFVTQRSDLLFGYDIRGTLNRDRSFMDEWDLKERLGRLLNVASTDEAFRTKLVRMLFEGESLESDHAYSSLVYNDEMTEAIEAKFDALYGANAIPCDGPAEVSESTTLGIKGVQVPSLLYRVLKDRRGSVATHRARRQSMPSRVWERFELSSAERENLAVVEALLKVRSELSDVTVEVVTFNDLRTVHARDGFTLRIPREGLLDMTQTMSRAIKCAAPLVQGATDAPHELAVSMITGLLSLDDTALAIKLLVARAS